MTRDLRFEAVYPHPIDKVWRAVTEPDAIARWLMKNDFAPRVGHRFRFTAPPQPGWDGIVNGEVLTVEPPHKLAYSWKGGPLDTVVTISLTPAPGGTRLVLEHTGFRGPKALLVSLIMGRGWKGIVAKRIRDVVDQLVQGGDLSALVAGCADRG
ncbi:MAG TPA: SRPBCC domain-containing protein [Vicinamibacterales bacterium]|jgi:uncharacterized protein YndB with AHSA1/START domain|nr:SRPBCC domain-containing protein [Vicinamibacterales bacterium]